MRCRSPRRTSQHLQACWWPWHVFEGCDRQENHVFNSPRWIHMLEEKHFSKEFVHECNLPVLDHRFESMRVSCHELVGLAEAELDWVVASVEWVVKGSLVWTQIHQQLSSPLVLLHQPLPDWKETQEKHTVDTTRSPRFNSSRFRLLGNMLSSPQVHYVSMISHTEGGLGFLCLSVMRWNSEYCRRVVLPSNYLIRSTVCEIWWVK